MSSAPESAREKPELGPSSGLRYFFWQSIEEYGSYSWWITTWIVTWAPFRRMFYTESLLMSRRTVPFFLLFLLCLVAPYLYAAQKPYSTGKFLNIQQKTRDKVDLYLVNTPVTTAVPYFEISIEFGNADYVAEYTPRHSAEPLPEAWRAGETVQGRVDKHHVYLQRSDGSELTFIITKRTAVDKDTIKEKP